MSLKDHRFNCLNDCAVSILYHIDDIAQYLDRYKNVINGITILDRSFIEMEVLKPIYTAIAIVGIHILKPYHLLLLDKETKYSTLLSSFPKLHNNLLSISPEEMLELKHTFKFASKDHFEKSLPEKELLSSVVENISQYSQEICQILRLLLKIFADGFAYQKESILGMV